MIQRFVEKEHRGIGEKSALGGAELDIDLGKGEKLTYGEMVALAGDYFGSLEEMRKLSETDTGRAKLRWTRWLAFKEGAEPPLPDSEKNTIRDRYFKLASQNISHFSGGGTARASYREYHRRALVEAVLAGARRDESQWKEALAEEAFGNHFLTDSFAGGHIRTPRQQIKEWYQRQFPGSIDRFVNYMVRWLYNELLSLRFRLRGHPPIGDTTEMPITQGRGAIEGGLRDRIREQAGGAIEAFSLGDLISGAYHDQDNKGLFVVSDVDPSGKEVPGGYPWKAVGDGHLKESPDTEAMVAGSMKATQEELLQARRQGATNADALTRSPWYERYQMAIAEADAFGPPYWAEKFIPRENASGKNQELQWRWGNINDAMAKAIGEEMKTVAAELRGKAPDAPEEIWGFGAWIVGVRGTHLHVDVAFRNFADLLERDGLWVIEQAMGKPAR